MIRIVEGAGLTPWEKTFQNLRASRRTELEERFPNHVINAWMGQSAKVAEKSYLQVTPSHWEAGATTTTEYQNGGTTGGTVSANQGLSSGTTDGTTKPSRHEKTHSRRVQSGFQTPPVGLEPTTNGLTVRCSSPKTRAFRRLFGVIDLYPSQITP